MIYAVNKRTKEHRIASQGSGTSEMLRCYLHSSDEDLVQANPDGWISGLFDVCPLPRGASHEVRFDDGRVVSDNDPTSWCWSHDPARRIVAYRPILDTNPEPPAWDGESWPPPIGCVLETKASEAKAKIIAIEDGHVIGWDAEYAFSGTLEREHCRPIRSEEDRAVEEMVSIFNVESGYSFRDLCRALYRAGYRKTGGES